jgi:hypothetical protein
MRLFPFEETDMNKKDFAIVIYAALLALVFFIQEPLSVDAQYSPALDQTYSATTEVCFALKTAERLPANYGPCSIGAVAIGGSTSQFDITNPSGSTCRYTFDGTGTDPEITADMPGAASVAPAGSIVEIQAQNFAAANNGYASVQTSATDYFEIRNPACSAENDKTIGTGSISFRVWERSYGGATSQFDITNPTGTTFRYTWDGTGTNPGINSSTFRIGDRILIGFAYGLSYGNSGFFTVTGSGDNYFEITNASGVAEANQVIGNGRLENRGQ